MDLCVLLPFIALSISAHVAADQVVERSSCRRKHGHDTKHQQKPRRNAIERQALARLQLQRAQRRQNEGQAHGRKAADQFKHHTAVGRKQAQQHGAAHVRKRHQNVKPVVVADGSERKSAQGNKSKEKANEFKTSNCLLFGWNAVGFNVFILQLL